MTFDPSDWAFFSAPLAPDRAEGRAEADGSLSIRLPSRRACAWWEREIAVASRGVRFRAEARVALGAGVAVGAGFAVGAGVALGAGVAAGAVSSARTGTAMLKIMVTVSSQVIHLFLTEMAPFVSGKPFCI